MTRTLKGLMNLKYVEVHHVPYVKNSRFGRGIDAEVLKRVERQVAHALVTQRRPLGGAEVQFFRSVLGMSQKQLGAHLGYSDVAILKWERNRSRRLDRVNEVAVRALMAGLFRIKLLANFDTLLGAERSPKKLTLEYGVGI